MKKKIKKIIMTFAMVLMVMAAVKATTIEAKAAGLFDPVYYAQTYPDVVAALGTDATVLYNHYISFGQKEGRIPYAGGQPGGIVDGIVGTTAQPQPQAPTTTGQLQTATGLPLPSPENPIIISPCTGSKYDLVYDLSNWTAEQWDNFYKRQAEFDASEYAKVGWTEAQVQERLLSLKSMFPEGTVVGSCGAGASKIEKALYGTSRDFPLGYDKNEQRVIPIGMVWANGRLLNEDNLRNLIRVGDRLQTKGTDNAGHVMIVLSHDDYGITVVESSWNGDEAMHWGRKISWNELENGGNDIYSMANKLVSINHRGY